MKNSKKLVSMLLVVVMMMSMSAIVLAKSQTENPITRAVGAPTSEAPYYPFTHNWSGTENYTYSDYYFKGGGEFNAYADGPFEVDFYYKDGTYVDTIVARYENGVYEALAYTYGFNYYYVVLDNKSSSDAKNATYEVK